MAEQTLAELEAELTALRAARIEILQGTQVKEVWRDGRRVTYNTASLDALNAAILDTEARIAAVQSPNASRGRFRALKPRFN
jgi:hypothetical protein